MKILISGIFTALLLLGCSSSDPSAENKPGMMVLTYQESEPDIQPYITRYIINKDFMRIDDGVDNGSFTLLDRKKEVIYSVTRENRRITKISPVKIRIESPRKLVLDATRTVDKKAPKIDGKTPETYDLKVNGITCRKMTVVKGMGEKALSAMREFRRILSTVHMDNLKKTPPDMRDPCFIAHDIVNPVRVLQYGLPIHEILSNGKQRILMDIKDGQKEKPELFKIPADYKVNQIGGKET